MKRAPIPGHPGISRRSWTTGGGHRRIRFDSVFRGPDGREHSRTFNKLGDADRWRREQIVDSARGPWIDPAAGKETLGRFADAWWDATGTLAPSTRRRYRSLIDGHIKPALGDRRLASVQVSDIRSFISTLAQKGLAPKTTRHAYTLLMEILRDAQEDNKIASVPQPKRSQRRRILPRLERKEQRYLDHAEVERLAQTAPLAPRYTALVLLGAYGALRWGELAGLRVSRLRLLEHKVEVAETDQGVEPKWGSAGIVTIPRYVAEMLAHHLKACPPGPIGLVFTAPEGGALSYSNFYRRHWVPAVQAAGLAPLRIHDLRHTAVALAVAAGAHPKEIQELCRHRSITTTLNEYGHLFEQLHERLAERLDQAALEARAGYLRDRPGAEVVSLPGRAPESPA